MADTPLQPPPEDLDYLPGPIALDGVNRSEPAWFTTLALGFPGILLLVFGLPMSICLPAGIIFGHSRLNWIGYLLLLATSALGATFLYAANLLLHAAAAAFRR